MSFLMRSNNIGWRRVVLIILGILFLIVVAAFIPWNTSISSHTAPVQDYAEALKRIQTLEMQEPTNMNPVCRLQFMTHNKKVDKAIVLVHGYTNCPQQFHDLGQQFYDLGYNVLIAPLPHHGLADRMTDEHAKLTAEELAAYADEVVDIAQGLGDHVSMMGLSLGGVVTAWAAQNRSDLDLAVIISPALGFKQIPTLLTAPAMNIYAALPDSFVWWYPDEQANGGPPHAYPRYSKHALMQGLRLGFATRAIANRQPPAAKRMVVVFNANDTAVNNELTMEFVKTWLAHGANLSTYEFPADLKLGHDLIDPSQPDQRADVVYPQLINLVDH